MKKSFRRVSVIAAIVLIVCTSLSSCSGCAASMEERALINEIGGCSETFVGAVSESEYSSAEDAVEAYVKDEIVFNSHNCDIVDVSLTDTLSVSDAGKLGIPDDALVGAKRVMKYDATYTDSDRRASAGLQKIASLGTYHGLVYVIDYEEWFKYFAPAVNNGDPLSKSYLDSIFSSEKYENCTLTQTVEISVKINVFFVPIVQQNATLTSTVKYDGNKILFNQKMDSGIDGIDSFDELIYVELDEYGNVDTCYMNKNDGSGWQRAYLQNPKSVKPFGEQYLHHSYFTKTDYGCTINDENLDTYISQALSLASSELNTVYGDMESSGSVNYYVSEGALAAILSNITLTMDYEESGVTARLNENVKTTVKCSDFGTTTVEDPIN